MVPPKRIGEVKIGNGNIANDDQLVRQARRGNATAFTQLYRQYYEMVFRYCVHRLFEKQAAEDVTSEVFLSVVENLGSFKGGDEQFKSWLYKIATAKLNNYLRRKVRRNRLLKGARKLADEKNTVNQKTDDEDVKRKDCLKEALFSLKPRYQTVITMRFFEKMKHKEIAELLGLSEGTVRSQLARGLEKLKNKIPAYLQED